MFLVLTLRFLVFILRFLVSIVMFLVLILNFCLYTKVFFGNMTGVTSLTAASDDLGKITCSACVRFSCTGLCGVSVLVSPLSVSLREGERTCVSVCVDISPFEG